MNTVMCERDFGSVSASVIHWRYVRLPFEVLNSRRSGSRPIQAIRHIRCGLLDQAQTLL